MSDRKITFTLTCELVYDDEWKDFCPLVLVVDVVKKMVAEGNFEIADVEDEEM